MLKEIEKTRTEYIEDLKKIQDMVYQMGLKAEKAIDNSLKALLTCDRTLAQSVMDNDDEIDNDVIKIEDQCILLIAKQQPIAHDLRVIATGFKISTDIERIGDHAFDIARTARNATHSVPEDCVKLVAELGECAKSMTDKAMESYRTEDVKLADEVRHMDREMDDIFRRTFLKLSDHVQHDQSDAGDNTTTMLLFIARFLERIGDHAVNVAEWVIYLQTAERIHTTKSRYLED